MSDPAPAATSDATERAEVAHAGRAKRRQRIQAAVAVVLLLVIFGVVLPQFVDYGEVWEAIRGLSGEQFLALLALGLLRIPIVAAQYASVIPGLTIKESMRSYLASNSVAEFAPPPADLAIRYGMYRAQGIDGDAAGTGILLTGLFDNAVKLAIPVFALIALVVSGIDDTDVWVLLAIGLAALVGGAVLVVAALRSEQLARRLGEAMGRFISWFLVRFHRNPLEDLGPKAVGLRAKVADTLRRRWSLALLATLAGQFMSYLVTLVALRFVGVGADEVDWVSLLVAFALVLILTALPLTPGGIGVAAVGYTAILAQGDPFLANSIAAASFLTRLFTWLLPMLVGFVPLVAWRRRQKHPSPG